jgi:hypothetical protein
MPSGSKWLPTAQLVLWVLRESVVSLVNQSVQVLVVKYLSIENLYTDLYNLLETMLYGMCLLKVLKE